MPQVRTVCRTSTASNQPQRRLRPVLMPNSLPRRPIFSPISFVQLGRKRPLADPGGVGLADAQDIANAARAHAGSGRRLRRHRVGGRHIGIGAMVDIEQRALRALEQDALALAALEVEQPPHGLRRKAAASAPARQVPAECRPPSISSSLSPRRSALWCASSRSILCGSVSRSARSISRIARRPTLSS